MNQYQKTTEKSIAEAAEVSPVSIYNYFGSKDNLVALCVNDLFEEVINTES